MFVLIMMGWFGVAALLLAGVNQEPDLGAALKKGRWQSVLELSSNPDHKTRLASLARSPDPEVKWWAGAALAELEAREKAGAAYPEPYRVTVDAKDRPVTDVVGEILGKSGLTLENPAFTTPSVTARFKQIPFLEALLEICAQGKVSLVPTYGGTLQLKPDSRLGGRWVANGPIALSLSKLRLTREIRFVDPPREKLTVGFKIQQDPRLDARQRNHRWNLVSARDDKGRSLISGAKNAALNASWSHGSRNRGYSNLQVELKAPAEDAAKIALIRGIAKANVAKETHDVVFEDLSSGKVQTKTVDGIKATLRKCVRTRQGHEVELEISSDRPHGSWWMPQMSEVRLEDKSGTLVAGSRGGSQAGGKYRLQFRDARKGGTLERIRIPVVSRIYERSFYLQLEDIPLR